MKLSCCIPGCGNSSTTTPRKSLFRFPSNEERCQEWLHVIKIPDLAMRKNLHTTSIRICSDHFNDDAFTSTERKKLWPTAVPEPAKSDYQETTSASNPSTENPDECQMDVAESCSFDVCEATSDVSDTMMTAPETRSCSQADHYTTLPSTSKLTPKTRRIKTLRSTVNILKKKALFHLKSPKHIAQKEVLVHLRSKLSPTLFALVKEQLKQSSRTPRGRPHQSDWLLTLNTSLQLWNSLKENISFLLMHRLNNDSLENTFASVRRLGGNKANPTCHDFRYTIRKVMAKTLIQYYSKSNSEEDSDVVLMEMAQEPSSNLPVSNVTESQEQPLTNISLEFLPAADLDMNEQDVLVYIAGYIAFRILKQVDQCKQCSSLLTKPKSGLQTSVFMYFKEYADVNQGLTSPSDELINLLNSFHPLMEELFDKVISQKNVCKKIRDSLLEVHREWLNEHKEHQKYLREYLITLYIRIIIHGKIKVINNKRNVIAQDKRLQRIMHM